jgi:glutaredoxin 3
MPKIRIFSTPTCTYCIILKRYLDEKNVEYEDIDISQNEEAQKEMIAKTNQMGVPVIDIDGEFIIGFDKGKINNILNIKE